MDLEMAAKQVCPVFHNPQADPWVTPFFFLSSSFEAFAVIRHFEQGGATVVPAQREADMLSTPMAQRIVHRLLSDAEEVNIRLLPGGWDGFIEVALALAPEIQLYRFRDEVQTTDESPIPHSGR
jgi:hypothetical protein